MTGATEQVSLTAPDISCGHCVATVQEAVGSLQGVERVAADAQTKRVEVVFDSTQTSVAEIEAALDEAGYPVAR
jgi:copper chaperone